MRKNNYVNSTSEKNSLYLLLDCFWLSLSWIKFDYDQLNEKDFWEINAASTKIIRVHRSIFQWKKKLSTHNTIPTWEYHYIACEFNKRYPNFLHNKLDPFIENTQILGGNSTDIPTELPEIITFTLTSSWGDEFEIFQVVFIKSCELSFKCALKNQLALISWLL